MAAAQGEYRFGVLFPESAGVLRVDVKRTEAFFQLGGAILLVGRAIRQRNIRSVLAF